MWANELTEKQNIKNLESATHNIKAFLRTQCRVNATSTIIRDGLYPMVVVKSETPAAAKTLSDVLNTMAACLEYRGVPVGQIAQAEDNYNDIGPVVLVRGHTAAVKEIAGRLMRPFVPA